MIITKYNIRPVISLIVLLLCSMLSISAEGARQEPTTIKVVMSAAFVSDTGISVYSDMFQYLAARLNRMVATGEADASAVDSLVYDYEKLNNPEYVRKTRVIDMLGPAGIPPVVISVKTPKQAKEKIKNTFINMTQDPAGKKILAQALVDRFVEVGDDNYNGIRLMYKKSLDSGYRVIR